MALLPLEEDGGFLPALPARKKADAGATKQVLAAKTLPRSFIARTGPKGCGPAIRPDPGIGRADLRASTAQPTPQFVIARKPRSG